MLIYPVMNTSLSSLLQKKKKKAKEIDSGMYFF